MDDEDKISAGSTEHKFGGAWTEIKLDAIVYYLECYTRALTHKKFDLWYIDAFAGTGERTVETTIGGLFEGRPIETQIEARAGSARRALGVSPPFQHFIFIEENIERCKALERLKSEYPSRDIQCICRDANAALREIVQQAPWIHKNVGPARGVVFLDPYALQVDWDTLEALAKTMVLDVWYLFPLRDVVRQLALDFGGIGPKAPMLDRVLGKHWRELYRVRQTPRQAELFGSSSSNTDPLQRDASWREVESWFRGRLESVFSYCSEPLPLLTPEGRQIFSLFLTVSNPSKPAIDLAKHFASYVRRYYGPEASHQTSDL